MLGVGRHVAATGPQTRPPSAPQCQQARAGAGYEGARRNLAFEPAAPPPWHRCRARRAGSFWRNAVAADVVAEPLDERLATARTVSVLSVADLPGQVSRVDEPQSRLTANLGCTQQHVGGGVLRLSHLVVAVKRGDMPRDIRRDVRNERR